MAVCKTCGVVLTGTPKFCPECGAPIVEKDKDSNLEYVKETDDYIEEDDDFEDDEEETVYSKAEQIGMPVPNLSEITEDVEEEEEDEVAPPPAAKPKMFGRKKEVKQEEVKEVQIPEVEPTDPDDPEIDPYWDDIIAETEEELVKLPKEMLIKGLGLVVAVFLVIAWLIIIL